MNVIVNVEGKDDESRHHEISLAAVPFLLGDMAASELIDRIVANEKAIKETIPATYVKQSEVSVGAGANIIVKRNASGNIIVTNSIMFDEPTESWSVIEGEGDKTFASTADLAAGLDELAGKDSDTAASDTVKGAKKYSDSLAVNYATAAQGAKADTALQPAALEAYYTQSQVDAMFGFEVIS